MGHDMEDEEVLGGIPSSSRYEGETNDVYTVVLTMGLNPVNSLELFLLVGISGSFFNIQTIVDTTRVKRNTQELSRHI